MSWRVIIVCMSAMSSWFFCKQKTAYEMRISDWSSDVCSSDLTEIIDGIAQEEGQRHQQYAETRHANHRGPEHGADCRFQILNPLAHFGLDKLYLFLSQMRALGGKVLQQSHDVITARRSLRTARGARRAVDPTIIVHRRPPSSLRAVWVWEIPALGSYSLPTPVTPVMEEPAPL